MPSPAARVARFMVRNPGAAITASLAVLALIYFAILTRGSFALAHKTPSGFAFNSMLLHLLDGQFDVNPETIANEGFLVNGKVYSYFGIFPALFRLIFLPLVDLTRTNLTSVSCLVADLIAVGAQLAIILKLFRRFGVEGREYLLLAFFAVSLFSGPQFFFLRPSIYQEPVFWALAFSYVFIYFAIDILLFCRIATAATLALMAGLAGLTVLTRVSVAVALYAAMGVMLIHTLATAHLGKPVTAGRIMLSIAAPRYWLPVILLLLFAAIAGYVNFMRFGNPLKFIDLHYQLVSTIENPDRLPRLDTYGEFNLARLWYEILYYFIPIWMLRGPDGLLLFPEFRHRYLDMVELPPGSFFLSDPLILAFAGFAVWRMIGALRSDALRAAPLLALAVAFAIPPLLELCAISVSFRYRGDFYPSFIFLAATGLSFVLSLPPDTYRSAWLPRLAWPLALVSIASSVVLLGLYWLSPYGDGEKCVKDGWIHCYESRLPGRTGASE